VHSGQFRVSTLRAAVAAAVRENTLRGVARDIGLSAPAVQNFIEGAEPRRPSTVQKLEGWYVRHLASGKSELSSEVVRASILLLVRDLPPVDRARVVAEVLELVAAHHSSRLGFVPRWLDQAQGHGLDPDPA